jgi:hypothetical protein
MRDADLLVRKQEKIERYNMSVAKRRLEQDIIRGTVKAFRTSVDGTLEVGSDLVNLAVNSLISLKKTYDSFVNNLSYSGRAIIFGLSGKRREHVKEGIVDIDLVHRLKSTIAEDHFDIPDAQISVYFDGSEGVKTREGDFVVCLTENIDPLSSFSKEYPITVVDKGSNLHYMFEKPAHM